MTADDLPKFSWAGTGYAIPNGTMELPSGTDLHITMDRVSIPNLPEAAHVGNLNSASALEKTDYDIHVHNLLEARAGLDLIFERTKEKDYDRPLVRLLWAGVAVCYARSFSGRNALSAPLVFGDNELALLAHRDLWDARSKHFAHDVNDYRQSIVAAVLDQPGNLLAIADWQNIIELDSTFTTNARLLVRDSLTYVQKRLVELDDVLAEEVRQMTPAERLSLPAPRLTTGGWENIKRSRR